MKTLHQLLLATLLSVTALTLSAQDFGQPMPKAKAVSIDKAMAKSKKYSSKPALFSGRIVEVCQEKGCWMMLENNGKAARVKTLHKFFLPKDASGNAVVYGTLKEVELTDEQQKHHAAESKLPVSKQEWQVIATSIRVVPNKG